MSESAENVFEINQWYGIHYPVDQVPNIISALSSTQFNKLSTDEREIIIDKRKYIRNVNSDFNETRGVIFSDDMSVQGDESESPSTFCKFDPTALVSAEESCSDCVSVLTDIYDIIVAFYKKNKLSVACLYFGWASYNCEWADESSDESSDEKPAHVHKSANKVASTVNGVNKVNKSTAVMGKSSANKKK